MRAEYWFPSALIALDVCAAMPYAWQGNWRMMIYWLAAATLLSLAVSLASGLLPACRAASLDPISALRSL